MKFQAIKNITRAVSLTTIAFMFSIIALGQSNTGSITGVVSDPNGAVVPNATVTVTNQGTNEKHVVQTDGDGRYEVPVLSTGVYTVEASATGFQASSVKDLRLAVSERARADVTLGVSGIAAAVTVI
ncbi:MAG TPA: carboxypeptidase-like regulatory domain-containing protein, partial [Pyrinomonadaceae bacterium]|nr:carboxypeptidase-like regulatory domain-containing protein [Pyrinomonadaceae bacterium]